MPSPMIADADVSPEIVRSFAAHMEREIGATIQGPPVPGYLRAYVSIMGGDPSRYALTLGRSVYLPVPIGPTAPGWSGWSQIVTITHECQHVLQGQHRSMIERAIDYATSTARRTQTETECLAAEMELELWRRGVIEPWWFSSRAMSLGGYHVSAVDLAVAERHLCALAPTVRRSGYVTHAGRVAIQWLNLNARELRASR